MQRDVRVHYISDTLSFDFLAIVDNIHKKPETIFKMILADMRESVDQYLPQLIKMEHTHFLGREPYVRKGEVTNHQNGFYNHRFTLKRSAKFG